MNYQFGVSTAFGKCQINKSDCYLFETYNNENKSYIFLALSDGKGKVEEGMEVSKWTITFLKNGIQEKIQQNVFNFTDIKEIYYKMNLNIKEYNKRTSSAIYASLLTIIIDGEYMYIVNIGSSRAYLVYEDKITKLIEEKDLSTLKRICDESNNKLGNCEEEDIEYQFLKIPKNSCVLLCSDGIHKVINNVKMHSLIKKSGNAQQAAENIVNYAKKISGIDDMTMVIFSYDGKSIFKSAESFQFINISIGLIALVIVIGAFAIFKIYKHSQKNESNVFKERNLRKQERAFTTDYEVEERNNILNQPTNKLSIPTKQVNKRDEHQKRDVPLKTINRKDGGYIEFSKEEVRKEIEESTGIIEREGLKNRTLECKTITAEKGDSVEDIGVLVVNTAETDCQVKVFEGYTLISVNRSGEKINLPLSREYKIEVSKEGKFIGEQDLKLDTKFKVIDIGIQR